MALNTTVDRVNMDRQTKQGSLPHHSVHEQLIGMTSSLSATGSIITINQDPTTAMTVIANIAKLALFQFHCPPQTRKPPFNCKPKSF